MIYKGVRNLRFAISGETLFLVWYNLHLILDDIQSLYLCSCDIDCQNAKIISILSKEISQVPISKENYDKFLTIRVVYVDGTQANQSGPGTPPFVPSLLGIPGIDPVTGQQREPRWLLDLSEDEQNEIKKQYYFETWFESTPLLDSDPRKIFSDNPGFNSDSFKWRNDSNILFHGDEIDRAPREVFSTGLTAIAPVSGKFNMRQSSEEGALSSFSYWSRTGVLYAYDYNLNMGYVYLTNAPGGVEIDLMRDEAEVAFITGVKSKYIIGALGYNRQKGKPEKFIKNKEHDIWRFFESTDILIIFSTKPTDSAIKLINLNTGVVDLCRSGHFILKGGVSSVVKYSVELVDPSLNKIDVCKWIINGDFLNALDGSVIELDEGNVINNVLIIQPQI